MATNLCFLVLNLKRISCSAVNYLIYFYCFLLLLISVFSHHLTKNSALFSLFIDLSLLSSLDKEQCTIFSPLIPWQRTVHCFLLLLTLVSSCPLTKNSALFSLSFDFKFALVFWQRIGGGCLVIWDFPLDFSVVSSIKNSILFI